MLVIGIDPGTARTGYGLVRQGQDGDLSAVDFGVIETSSGLTVSQRLLEISERLSELLVLHSPEGAAAEKLFVREHVNAALSVGQASGAAILTMAGVGLKVKEYSAAEVKQAVCGHGAAGKGQVQDMVRVLLGMEERPRPDDAADALAVAICHIHTESTRERIRGAS